MSSPLKLSAARFKQASDFLRSSEPLQAALFAFHFENASPDTVTSTLAPFQNLDGGFGGLEPDLGFTTSSTLSTCAALHPLADLGIAADHPLVRRAFDYLNASFDAALKLGRFASALQTDVGARMIPFVSFVFLVVLPF